MDELTQIRLIVLAVVGAIAAAWVISNRSAARREKRFVELGRSLGVEVEEVRHDRPTLEEAFLRMVKHDGENGAEGGRA